MKKNLLILAALFLVSLNFGMALSSSSLSSQGSVKLNQNINITQTCVSCTYVNISSISSPPNNNKIIGEVVMSTIDGVEYYYELNGSNLSNFGTYFVNGYGDPSGTITPFQFTFDVTPNGEPLKSDQFVALVYIVFCVIFLLSVYQLIINLAKLASSSETVLGMAFSWGIYFVMLINYWLIMNYMTSSFLRDNIVWVISVFGFTNFFLPLISLFVSIFKRSTDVKRPLTVQEMTGRRLMGYD